MASKKLCFAQNTTTDIKLNVNHAGEVISTNVRISKDRLLQGNSLILVNCCRLFLTHGSYMTGDKSFSMERTLKLLSPSLILGGPTRSLDGPDLH